jgi:hypothetical protein
MPVNVQNRAVHPTPFSTVGTHTITAPYSVDANLSASGIVDLTVGAAPNETPPIPTPTIAPIPEIPALPIPTIPLPPIPTIPAPPTSQRPTLTHLAFGESKNLSGRDREGLLEMIPPIHGQGGHNATDDGEPYRATEVPAQQQPAGLTTNPVVGVEHHTVATG